LPGIPQALYALAGEGVVIEPYLGAGGAGDVYGPPVPEVVIVDEKRRLVRAANGDQAVSETTFFCELDVDVPLDSQVTVRGRTTTVIAVSRLDGRHLPVPSHLEVNLA
jgi:hypothetical protein